MNSSPLPSASPSPINQDQRTTPATSNDSPNRWFTWRRRDQWGIFCLAVLGLGLLVARWSYLWAMGHEQVMWEPSEPAELMQIDINSADWPELALLPDIGETMAKRIAEDRKEKGKFFSPQDLARVKGIGPKTVENLAPYVAPIPASGKPSSTP